MPSEDLQVPRRVRREGRGFKGEIDGSTFQQCLSQNQGEQGLEGPEETRGGAASPPHGAAWLSKADAFFPRLSFLLSTGQLQEATDSPPRLPGLLWREQDREPVPWASPCLLPRRRAD